MGFFEFVLVIRFVFEDNFFIMIDVYNGVLVDVWDDDGMIGCGWDELWFVEEYFVVSIIVEWLYDVIV